MAAGAQQVQPDATVGEALRSLASRAHDVFVGQVESITRRGGVVEVRFRVDESVAGTQSGEVVLREWAGLWPPGLHRYLVGLRAMVFLRDTSDGRLSSPVDDAEGVVPVLVQGVGAEPLVDVRRLAARVQRSTTEALSDVENGALALKDAKAVVTGWRKPIFREPIRRPLPVGFRPAPLPPLRGAVTGDPGAGVIWQPVEEVRNAR
jgi:hypothetical protein